MDTISPDDTHRIGGKRFQSFMDDYNDYGVNDWLEDHAFQNWAYHEEGEDFGNFRGHPVMRVQAAGGVAFEGILAGYRLTSAFAGAGLGDNHLSRW